MWNSYKWGIIAMITPRIPKKIAHPVCPVNAINPATPIATATPDQPDKFGLCALFFILTNLQISKVSADFKSVGSSNYTTHTNENEISTHEETFGFTRASLRSVGKHRFTGNLFLINQTSFLEDTNFPNSLSANFCKPLIQSRKNKFEILSPSGEKQRW